MSGSDAGEGRAGSFGRIAAEYGRLRPAPAAGAIDWLLPEPPGQTLDLAAGAGTLTRELVSRGVEVVAVEPDDRMRSVLVERNPGVPAYSGTAEEIPLPDGDCAGVLASSAWHWFDAERAVPEIARVLRPGGRLGVVWNALDTSVPWVGEWYAGTRRRDVDRAAGRAPSHQRRIARGELMKRQLDAPGGPFRDLQRAEFTEARRTGPADAAALLGTYSRVILLPEGERAELLADAERWLCERFGLAPDEPRLDLPFRTQCWRAERVGTERV